MLKIKDSVDLKELEKFEFESAKNCEYSYIKRIDSNCKIKINKNRFLETWDCFNNMSTDDIKKTIDDLIKANLVEEVSNE